MKQSVMALVLSMAVLVVSLAGVPSTVVAEELGYKILPPACLPDRAEPWNVARGEEFNQAPCHCPPKSFCPKTHAQWQEGMADPRRLKMSEAFVIQCCSLKCPPGTDLAGRNMPSDGVCNRPDPACVYDGTFPPTPAAVPFTAVIGGNVLRYTAHNPTCWAKRWANSNKRKYTMRCLTSEASGSSVLHVVGGRSNTPACWHYHGNFLSREGCILGGTKISMADGTQRAIENLKHGDVVVDQHGAEHSVEAVNGFNQDVETMYGINGGEPFITVEHPILTTDGWKAVDPEKTVLRSDVKLAGKLAVGDKIVTADGTITVKSIDAHTLRDDRQAYNLKLSESGKGFLANGVAVLGFTNVQVQY